jgi:hypothetical protein
MDLLTPPVPPRRTGTALRRLAAWLAVAAWLGVAACLSLPGARRSEPSFPHRVHVVDNGLACTFCHGSVRAADDPGMPPPELCATCHDRFDADKPPERRVAAFYGADSRYRTVAVSGRGPEVRFSHRTHVTTAKLDCERCHADIETQDEVPLQPLATKDACMSCHAQHGRGNECADCHTQIDRSWTPPSHAAGWTRLHGDAVHEDTGSSADRCTLCHDEQASCNVCHQQQLPRSHDQAFRTRTHGLHASLDRSRCHVCHATDSCQQCHESTRPRSHRGGFGAPQDRHCVSCHFPLADVGCSVCHRDTPSHDLATPLPDDHSPAMNCRTCHGNGVRLPHPDGGHACTVCHR